MTFPTLCCAGCALVFAASAVGGGIPRCLPWGEMREAMEARYGEQPIARAIEARGSLFELLQSGDGVTWSLLAVDPHDKTACVIAAGEYWQRLKPNSSAHREPASLQADQRRKFNAR